MFCIVTRNFGRPFWPRQSKAEPFKMWLAQEVGTERFGEIADPEKAVLRGVDYY